MGRECVLFYHVLTVTCGINLAFSSVFEVVMGEFPPKATYTGIARADSSFSVSVEGVGNESIERAMAALIFLARGSSVATLDTSSPVMAIKLWLRQDSGRNSRLATVTQKST